MWGAVSRVMLSKIRQVLHLNVPENIEQALESVRIYIDGTNVRPNGEFGRVLNVNCRTEDENRRALSWRGSDETVVMGGEGGDEEADDPASGLMDRSSWVSSEVGPVLDRLFSGSCSRK